MKFIINKKEKSKIPSTKLYDLGAAELGLETLLNDSIIYIDQNTIPVLKINDSHFLINNFNPNNYKEDFEILLTESDLISFGGSGSGGGDFIPLAGTTEGNTVSGDIEFDENERVITKTQDSVKYSVSPYNGGLGNFTLGANISAISDLLIACVNANALGNSMSFMNVLNGNFSELSQSSEDGIAITSTSSSAYGIRGLIDFTSNIGELDFVQKKYVDERGSVFNATTATLSASDLNTAYPNAKDGFSVIAPNVVGGGKYYIKAGAGWVYQQILAVV